MHPVNRTMESWIIQTRNTLLKSERENITSRLRQWESIVNECTKNEHVKTFGLMQSDLIPLPTYKQSITDNDMKYFLNLILEWQGLNRRMSHPSNVPKTYKEYLNKSKNWMNGSRAKHYSRTLYPHMIDCAETYAQNVANVLYPIDTNKSTLIASEIVSESSSIYTLADIQKQCNSLFRDILMYSYLVQFAQCRLRVTKIGRRVYLLCDNSITGHKSNTLAKMLQRYAQNHPYVDQFPSHREEIVDHFNKQKEASLHQLFLLYQKRKTMEFSDEHKLIHNTLIHTQNIMNLMDFIKTNSKSNDSKNVHIDPDAFNVIMSVGVMLEEKQKENDQRINGLQQYLQLHSKSDSNTIIQKKQQKHEQKHEQQWRSSMNQESVTYTYSNHPPFNVKKVVNDTEMYDSPVRSDASPPNCFNGLPPFDDASICKDFDRPQSNSLSFAPSNLNTFVSNFNEFECDAGGTAAMSVDNNLLFSTQNDDLYTNYDNFNDSHLNYDNMYLSSSSGP